MLYQTKFYTTNHIYCEQRLDLSNNYIYSTSACIHENYMRVIHIDECCAKLYAVFIFCSRGTCKYWIGMYNYYIFLVDNGVDY